MHLAYLWMNNTTMTFNLLKFSFNVTFHSAHCTLIQILCSSCQINQILLANYISTWIGRIDWYNGMAYLALLPSYLAALILE